MGPSPASARSRTSSPGAAWPRASGIASPTCSIAATLRDLGGGRDLAYHLDDVAVRVEHAQLPLGAVAPSQDLADALELALGAQLARVRLDVAQRPSDELC